MEHVTLKEKIEDLDYSKTILNNELNRIEKEIEELKIAKRRVSTQISLITEKRNQLINLINPPKT